MGIKTVLRYEVSCDHCDRVEVVEHLSDLCDIDDYDTWIQFQSGEVACPECWEKACRNPVLPSHGVTGSNQ